MRFHALMGHFVYTGRPANSRQLLKGPCTKSERTVSQVFARKAAHSRHSWDRCVPVSCRSMRFHALMGHFVYTGRPANRRQLLKGRPVQNRSVRSVRFSHARQRTAATVRIDAFPFRVVQCVSMPLLGILSTPAAPRIAVNF